MVELLFLMEILLEETSFICDLIPLLPGFYNTSTPHHPPTPKPKLQQCCKKFLFEHNTVKESWPYLRYFSSAYIDPYKIVKNSFSANKQK